MRIVGRLSRLTAGRAGVAVAAFGVVIARRLVRAVHHTDHELLRKAGAAETSQRTEDELTSRTAELEQANDRLRESNADLEAALAVKNDLTSMLTHDVAQPISSIANLAELLTGDWDDLPDDVRRELATKIDKNTQRLIKMMNDLQMLFRLDLRAVSARRSPVPLLEVARTVSTSDDVVVEIDENLAALADRTHLLVVLQNLVGNALAYGKPPVSVRAERRHEMVEISVRDHGPGIPDELLPRLFDRFKRGAGLGLFVVRHLVEANGGTVRHEHAEPHGALLVVSLEAV